jgi:hypothetical protein
MRITDEKRDTAVRGLLHLVRMLHTCVHPLEKGSHANKKASVL